MSGRRWYPPCQLHYGPKEMLTITGLKILLAINVSPTLCKIKGEGRAEWNFPSNDFLQIVDSFLTLRKKKLCLIQKNHIDSNQENHANITTQRYLSVGKFFIASPIQHLAKFIVVYCDCAVIFLKKRRTPYLSDSESAHQKRRTPYLSDSESAHHIVTSGLCRVRSWGLFFLGNIFNPITKFCLLASPHRWK